MLEPFELEVARDPDPMPCNFNPDPERGAEATMCVIPTQSREVVEHPERMKEKPNVMSEWIDRFTAGGAGVLLLYSKWFDSFTDMAEQIDRGVDPFAHVERRIQAAVRYCLLEGHAERGNVVVVGSSRHGFAAIHTLANCDEISGAIAHQPVVWWPNLQEFADSAVNYRNLILQRHSLYEWISRIAPKPLLVQTGYMDDRIGQYRLMRLIEMLRDGYETAGVSERFTHEMMGIPGHSGRVPDSALDSVPEWLKRHGFLE